MSECFPEASMTRSAFTVCPLLRCTPGRQPDQWSGKSEGLPHSALDSLVHCHASRQIYAVRYSLFFSCLSCPGKAAGLQKHPILIRGVCCSCGLEALQQHCRSSSRSSCMALHPAVAAPVLVPIEKTREEKKRVHLLNFGVNLTRSLVTYRAAQSCCPYWKVSQAGAQDIFHARAANAPVVP